MTRFYDAYMPYWREMFICQTTYHYKISYKGKYMNIIIQQITSMIYFWPGPLITMILTPNPGSSSHQGHGGKLAGGIVNKSAKYG